MIQDMVGGSGGDSSKHLLNFHFHFPHIHLINHHHHHHGGGGMNKHKEVRDRDRDRDTMIPKGYLAIMVGRQDIAGGVELQRFVVPVMYFNHPLFIQLLKEAEEEYGFDQKGTITIPCKVEEFMNVQGMIDRERSFQQQQQHHHHYHHHVVGCFRSSLVN